MWKQVVFINHSWISLTLQRDGDLSSVYSPKNGRVYILFEVGKIGKEGC